MDRVVPLPVHIDPTVTVLDLVRNGEARTRSEIARVSGLGRNVVSSRVDELVDRGILAEGLGRSTGGRAPRELSLCAQAGEILVAQLGATTTNVAVCDLAGTVLVQASEPSDITDGPEDILNRVATLFDDLLARQRAPVWGVGVGLPGPVEFTTGRPVSPPIMPGWDDFDVRGFFARRYATPVWVDNDVNVMALGEFRDPQGLARGHEDVIYVKVGYGIGAGLVSRGRLHRGADGCAGDIGHVASGNNSDVVCRCGQRGCLEALAGGQALARDGLTLAKEGRSEFLASLLAEGRRITSADIGRGAAHGDPACVDLLTQSAVRVGAVLAELVNFFNPSLVLLGGGVNEIGDLYLATVRQVVLGSSLPLATRSLLVSRSSLANTSGLKGAAFMVIDELMSRRRLGAWIGQGSPAGNPDLTSL